jgi:hypothetical protein
MQNHLVGTSVRNALYVGHRIWDPYVNAAGKAVGAGGSVTVREEWDSATGEPQHAVKEYRIDIEHGDLGEIGKNLAGLPCGTPVGVEVGTFESPRGTQWRNVVHVGAPQTAK